MYAAHSQPKPRRPAAAVATAGGLLAVCVALAAWLASARGLADPVQIPGWAISFQPPRGWAQHSLDAERYGQGTRYREPPSSGRTRELTLTRGANPGNLSAGQICLLVASELAGATRAPWRHRLERSSFGGLPGARLLVPRGAYIQVGMLAFPDGGSEAYVLTLVSQSPLDEHDIRLGETLARAVRFTTD